MELNTDKMLAKTEDGIGWMIFNDPERRNATSLEMWETVAVILDHFENDDGVRVVVMRGAGDKAFVSGADISQFEERRSNAAAAEEYGKVSEEGRRRMAGLNKPLIAMIQGSCLGGGVAIAMNADIRIASEDARFGIPAARLGLAYTPDSIRRLVHLVGPAFAKEILITARRFSAEEALRIGLVNRVVPKDSLEQTVREYARMILENAPLSMRAAKVMVEEVGKDPAERDAALMDRVAKACFDSEDYAEGRSAFMEKRKPMFTGR